MNKIEMVTLLLVVIAVLGTIIAIFFYPSHSGSLIGIGIGYCVGTFAIGAAFNYLNNKNND